MSDEFKTARLAEGFDEVAERVWKPNQALPEHAHPFSVHALVTVGEMWLTVGERTQHLKAGDEFHLALEERHAERYGPEGTTYLAARKHGR
jgi:quercetin dioxygenase-like cupin family protein